MDKTYLVRRSQTSGAVPTAATGTTGELIANTFDGRLWMRGNDGTDTIVEITRPLVSSIAQSGATSGQVIRWNGSAWAAFTIPATAPADITSGGAFTGMYLQWNGTAWTPTYFVPAPWDLNVNYASVGQFIGFDGESYFPLTVLPSNLGQQSATSGQCIAWNGTAWAPASLPYASLTSSQSFITSDVTLTNYSTWYTVLTVTLAAGTWLVLGNATMGRAGTGTRSFGIQINISTTTYASASQGLASATGNASQLSCQAIITLTSSTAVTLQAATNGAGDFVLANEINMGVGKATGIVAVRIA